jgi:hypothetical protein
MHRTASSDFQQLFTLGLVEISFHVNLTMYLVEHPFFRVAIFTIFGMNSLMSELNLNTQQGYTLSLRIHAQCHGCSGSRSGKQVFMGPRTAVGSTK